MMKRTVCALIAAAALCLLLTGCGNGRNDHTVSRAASAAGDAVSRAGKDLDDTVSRVESYLMGEDDRTDSTARYSLRSESASSRRADGGSSSTAKNSSAG